MQSFQLSNTSLRYYLNNLGPEGSETVPERNQRKRLEMWQENLQRQQKKQEKQQKVNFCTYFCTLDTQISFADFIHIGGSMGIKGGPKNPRPSL